MAPDNVKSSGDGKSRHGTTRNHLLAAQPDAQPTTVLSSATTGASIIKVGDNSAPLTTNEVAASNKAISADIVANSGSTPVIADSNLTPGTNYEHHQGKVIEHNKLVETLSDIHADDAPSPPPGYVNVPESMLESFVNSNPETPEEAVGHRLPHGDYTGSITEYFAEPDHRKPFVIPEHYHISHPANHILEDCTTEAHCHHTTTLGKTLFKLLYILNTYLIINSILN